MDLIGVYHPENPQQLCGLSGKAFLEQRGFLLSAEDVHANCACVGFAKGRLRNRRKLAHLLRIDENAAQSEFVLRAYEKWGNDYPTHLEGALVTGVFDGKRDLCVLSRDRIGDRPLFYCRDGAQFAFAEHPDVLLQLGLLRPVVDAEGVGELFALGPARTPGRTPYRDLLSLEAGCALIVEAGSVRIERYYKLPARRHEEDEQETVRHVRELIDQAVEEIMPLRPASMLSGGLDSTVLTAWMCRKGAHVKTFSVDYAQNDRYFCASSFQPERDAPYIALAAEEFGTEHMSIMLSQHALAGALSEAVDARGFPGMADIDSSLLLFAREIAPYAKHVVSGECGDEVFGGYPWFRDVSMMREDAFPWSGSVGLRESVLHERVAKKADIPGHVHRTLKNAVDAAAILPGEAADEACLRTMQQLCFRFFMANLQERAVCMCSACGLEVLTPFSDDRLLEYVYNVPWRMKFMGGQEKGLLRAAAGEMLPEKLRTRRKSPYPKTCSPEYAQIVVEMTQNMLNDPCSPILELIDRCAVEKIASSGLSPVETPWFGQLMAGPQMLAYLLQINEWMRRRNVEIRI